MGRWKVYTPETGYLYQGEKCSTGRSLSSIHTFELINSDFG